MLNGLCGRLQRAPKSGARREQMAAICQNEQQPACQNEEDRMTQVVGPAMIIPFDDLIQSGLKMPTIHMPAPARISITPIVTSMVFKRIPRRVPMYKAMSQMKKD
jgi:hypothetical protein